MRLLKRFTTVYSNRIKYWKFRKINRKLSNSVESVAKTIIWVNGELLSRSVRKYFKENIIKYNSQTRKFSKAVRLFTVWKNNWLAYQFKLVSLAGNNHETLKNWLKAVARYNKNIKTMGIRFPTEVKYYKLGKEGKKIKNLENTKIITNFNKQIENTKSVTTDFKKDLILGINNLVNFDDKVYGLKIENKYQLGDSFDNHFNLTEEFDEFSDEYDWGLGDGDYVELNEEGVFENKFKTPFKNRAKRLKSKIKKIGYSGSASEYNQYSIHDKLESMSPEIIKTRLSQNQISGEYYNMSNLLYLSNRLGAKFRKQTVSSDTGFVFTDTPISNSSDNIDDLIETYKSKVALLGEKINLVPTDLLASEVELPSIWEGVGAKYLDNVDELGGGVDAVVVEFLNNKIYEESELFVEDDLENLRESVVFEPEKYVAVDFSSLILPRLTEEKITPVNALRMDYLSKYTNKYIGTIGKNEIRAQEINSILSDVLVSMNLTHDSKSKLMSSFKNSIFDLNSGKKNWLIRYINKQIVEKNKYNSSSSKKFININKVYFGGIFDDEIIEKKNSNGG